MKRYSAKLLFQYCDKANNKPRGKKRLCEERIITFNARSAKQALSIAKKKGRSAQYDFKTIYNTANYFEFIGVMELLCLDYKCEEGEVWYEHRVILEPMERKTKLIPPENELEAIKTNE
jgi:hypothetical protein